MTKLTQFRVRLGGPARRRACLIAVALLAAACSGESGTADDVPAGEDDPWQSSVRYLDPEGLFEIDFPTEPERSEEVQGSPGEEFALHTLQSDVADDWNFSLAWSDAPPGTPLNQVQTIPRQTPEENAQRDGGTVTDQHETMVFGRPGLEFTVASRSAEGLYHDVQVVVGGRLYELTVAQRGDSREAFDRFVESFHLLQPPLRRGADFFAAAEASCAAFYTGRATPSPDAGPAERGAAVAEVADFVESLAEQLATMPVSPEHQGDAAAFIDSLRRSVEPARTFADAVAADAPNARELGLATRGDTDLTARLATENGALSCA